MDAPGARGPDGTANEKMKDCQWSVVRGQSPVKNTHSGLRTPTKQRTRTTDYGQRTTANG